MQKAIGAELGSKAPIFTTLRALAAVATRLGLDVSVDQLRRRFAVEPVQSDTPTFIAAARELGVEVRASRMTFKELPRVAHAQPTILRAKDGGGCNCKKLVPIQPRVGLQSFATQASPQKKTQY
jgi:hypothetical protein